MQLALKHARRNAGSIQDEKFWKNAMDKMKKDQEKETRDNLEKKAKSLAIAKDQLAQQMEKVIKETSERQAIIEEGQTVMQKDKEYNEKQAQEFSKRKEASIRLNQDLEKMRKQVQEHRQKEKILSAQEDKKINYWTERKAAQVQLKNQLERQWFLYS